MGGSRPSAWVKQHDPVGAAPREKNGKVVTCRSYRLHMCAGWLGQGHRSLRGRGGQPVHNRYGKNDYTSDN